MRQFFILFLFSLGLFYLPACISTSSTTSSSSSCTTHIDAAVPDWFKDNFTCIEAHVSGNFIAVHTSSVPSHKSYYFGSSSALYEDLPSGNHGNPNSIQAQNYDFLIPLNPTENASTTPTDFDAIGLAINSVIFYNNQAAPGDDLSREILTFDKGNGHPTSSGQYHYHIEPVYVTSSDAKLVGVLLDGFPVYGKLEEDGSSPNALDAAHGHKHATSHFSSGRYHYHITDDDPYIAGAYRGTPGSFTN